MTEKENKKYTKANRDRPPDKQNQPPLPRTTDAVLERNSQELQNSKASSHIRIPRMQNERESDKCIEKVVILISIILVVLTLPLSLLCVFMAVRQFERVVILRNGKVYKNRAFGPGLVSYLPCVDTVKFIDLRTIVYAVPPQEALTKDSLTVSVDAVVFYKIFDPIHAVINVTHYKSSTQYLAATTLRNALGTRKLAEVLANRPEVSRQVFELMKNITREWGVQIVRVEM
ncbi:unnamed protein product, partial [Brenthis ino]